MSEVRDETMYVPHREFDVQDMIVFWGKWMGKAKPHGKQEATKVQ